VVVCATIVRSRPQRPLNSSVIPRKSTELFGSGFRSVSAPSHAVALRSGVNPSKQRALRLFCPAAFCHPCAHAASAIARAAQKSNALLARSGLSSPHKTQPRGITTRSSGPLCDSCAKLTTQCGSGRLTRALDQCANLYCS